MWVMTCSVKLPSLAAKVFHSRWAEYRLSVNAMPFTSFIARSAASRSATLRSSGTLNGSSSTGVSNRPWAGGRPSSTTGLRRAVALAFAIRTASAATRSASPVDRWWLAAKPQAPSTSTRTPKPSVSPDWHAFDAGRLDVDRFLDPPDHAHVRVARAQGGGRVEGTVGQIAHWPESSNVRPRGAVGRRP